MIPSSSRYVPVIPKDSPQNRSMEGVCTVGRYSASTYGLDEAGLDSLLDDILQDLSFDALVNENRHPYLMLAQVDQITALLSANHRVDVASPSHLSLSNNMLGLPSQDLAILTIDALLERGMVGLVRAPSAFQSTIADISSARRLPILLLDAKPWTKTSLKSTHL